MIPEIKTNSVARISESVINEKNNELLKRNVIMPQANDVMTDDSHLISANIFPLPSAVTVSCANGGGAPANAFVFNVDYLTVSGTTDTYSDGFAGKMVSRLLASTRYGMGAICYGVTAEFTVTATGAALPSALGTATPVFLSSNTYGLTLPLNLNSTVDHTRKDQATNIQVWRCRINQSRFTQFRITVPAGATCVLTFNYQPNFSV